MMQDPSCIMLHYQGEKPDGSERMLMQVVVEDIQEQISVNLKTSGKRKTNQNTIFQQFVLLVQHKIKVPPDAINAIKPNSFIHII